MSMKIFGSGSVFPHDPADDHKFVIGSWHDLADRPFGEEDREVVFDQIAEFVEGQCLFEGVTLPISVGDSVTVTWNGAEYNCVVFDIITMGPGAMGIGNLPFITGVDTGEPFAIGVSPVDGRIIVMSADEGLQEASIKIETSSVKTIDPKYIPAGIGGGIVIVQDTAAASGVATVGYEPPKATMNAGEIAQAVMSGKTVYFTDGFEDFVPFIYGYRFVELMSGVMTAEDMPDPCVLFGALRDDGRNVLFRVYLDGTYDNCSYDVAKA